MNIEKAKQAYLDECHKIGKVPQHVTYMTYDQYSEKYTLGNESDGDFYRNIELFVVIKLKLMTT